MVRRVLLLCSTALVLSGCAQSLEDQAHDRLQDDLDAVHEEFLDRRARHADTTGAEALESLDPWGDAVASRVDGDDVLLVWGIGASASETDGWFMPTTTTASLGACVSVVVRTGEGGDDRGSVRSEAVACPEGTEILDDDGNPVDAFTTDLDGRRDDVPEPPYDPPVCMSGGDCSRGGG
ncbi:UNVERIFIED_ORG: hypothetical protein E4P37_19470 [Bacillus sp. AZ43]